MQLKHWTLLGFGAWLLSGSNCLHAQHVHTPKCAVTREMGAMIKERMLEERARIPIEEVQALAARRAITWIPLTLHIVGDNNGNGYIDLDEVLDMFCGLQKDYDDHEIQYYINGQFRYLNNTTLYNNAFSTGGNQVMNSNKVANSLNAYCGPSVQNQSASFYQPNWFGQGDYVFLLNAQTIDATINSAQTASHEFGHFFTLPHTFDGWEGIDYMSTYNGNNAPNSVGGVPVERVPRTGPNANCTTAGDGFCDTEADYFSDREPCPFTGTARDPLGNTLDPDETLMMSYFYDQCVSVFTANQMQAVRTNIISRGWSNFTPPTQATISDQAVLVSPAANAQVNLLSGTEVVLTWDPVPGATAYYVELDRSLFGSPLESIRKQLVYNGTSLTVPYSALQINRQYTWKVRPFNAVFTCPNGVASQSFNTVGISSVNDVVVNDLVMEVMPNPVRNGWANVSVQSNHHLQGALRLHGIDGRLLVNLPAETLQAGENVFQIPTDMLPAGIYVVTLTTELGTIQQKIVVER